ncbi:MAG: cob(I)yrinic acid a,c-diamide adenosyltransferase [Nitrospirae bacterium]|uniref:cob(I)yrinic acid a,c-diamide adenosyltransferase n=1 Tax=Candidatus Magnetobacterium casense TaxID=1455061 RepID=UPI0005901C89|nr:cob(I)yrinic acid a,c-diamide adenosyltransferase [Candidatus Magnetobacterium casensis]MBF0336899.1 cob(I)yrinic acid a,c-diamide adenosyltransferase [Nitrospirota bacterium]
MFKGYVQVYTGNGKGKTTAAVGLAVRAAGSGLRVFFAQFIKSTGSGEFHFISRSGTLPTLQSVDDLIEVRQYGMGFVRGAPGAEDIEAAIRGLSQCQEAVLSANYQVVILDEINVAMTLGLLGLDEVVELIQGRPQGVELVLTGRGAPQRVIELADLVTEFREIKHYFTKGVTARQGIEY